MCWLGLNSPDGNKLSFLQFLDIVFKAVSSLEDCGAFLLRYRRVKEPVPKSGKSTSYRTSLPRDDSAREALMKEFAWLRASDFSAPKHRRVATP